MRSLTIYRDSESFSIIAEYAAIFDHAVRGLPVYWNRAGMVGKLPVSVLLNAIDTFRIYRDMQRQGRITDIPAAAHTINWDQTDEHCPESLRPDQAE